MRCFGNAGAVPALLLLAAATHSTAAPSFFAVVSDSEAIAGPPYPTNCHRVLIAHDTNGVFECDGQLAVGIRFAAGGDGSYLDTSLLARGGHPPGDGFREDSCFDAMFHPRHPGEPLPEGSRFRLSMQLTNAHGEPGTLVAIHTERHVCDPLRYFDVCAAASRPEILCLVEFAEGVRHELTLLAELPATVTLTGAGVRIPHSTLAEGDSARPAEPRTYFTARPPAVFFVTLELDGGPGFDATEPMVSVSVSGRFFGGASPVQETTWGTIKAAYNE